MVKQRENYKIVISKEAQERINNNQCPSCGLPKEEYKRRKDWRCCSTECTNKYVKQMVTYGWPQLRLKAFVRDDFTCQHCGIRPKKKELESYPKEGGGFDYKWVETNMHDSNALIGDHIIPIALGGDEWDIDNVQTLCVSCDKKKFKDDNKKIKDLRKFPRNAKSHPPEQIQKIKRAISFDDDELIKLMGEEPGERKKESGEDVDRIGRLLIKCPACNHEFQKKEGAK
jgi:5-methylcytosine-specific restriction endonuclease McrA